jgi:hypothetical protein
MTDRQYLWGLSGGAMVLAIAGTFWFGLGLSRMLTPQTDWRVWTLVTLLQVGACAALLVAAFRLRRRSGFSRAEFRRPDEPQRAENRRIRMWFGWATAGEGLLVALGVWWFVHTNAVERIWPWIGLVVSLHLIPLARVFRVRAYYAAGIAGSLISLVAFVELARPHALAYMSGGMAIVMWLSAAYVLSNADRITSRAMREPWAA